MKTLVFFCLAVLVVTGSASANDTFAAPEALIDCVNEEPVVASCAEPFICDPGWAFFHRVACADKARKTTDAALDHFRDRLQPLLNRLDAVHDGGFATAEATADAAWRTYRSANCSVDRSAELDAVGTDEARDICYVRHGIRRLAVIRLDIDRFSFKLAAD